MVGLPFLNPRLSVEAVGFTLWDQSWVGIMITPWGINLLQLPLPQAPFEPVPADARVQVHLPAGDIEFLAAFHEQLGHYRLCSLFSPANQFDDQLSARLTARSVLSQLLDEQSPKTQKRPIENRPNPSRRRLLGL